MDVRTRDDWLIPSASPEELCAMNHDPSPIPPLHAVNTHAYSLQILNDGRVPVGESVALSLGGALQRGVEALHWRSFLAGMRSVPEPIRVSPGWSVLGEPAVEAILIEAGSLAVALSARRLFAPLARRVSNRLVLDEMLEKDASYGFAITAIPVSDPAQPPVFLLDAYPSVDACAVPSGSPLDTEFAGAGDFPVHLSREVLDDALRLAGQAGDAETGGVLFGRLLRDSVSGGPLLAVTHLCPAANGHGDATSFTFTPDTWSMAQTVLSERAGGEIMVGSYHSHPDFCRNCPPEKSALCGLRNPFFSEDDVRLHETVFPAAFSVGLLASHDGSGFVLSLWGWRDGFIARRAYLTS
jgi:proteasome lid subunit RPN8/RPN11